MLDRESVNDFFFLENFFLCLLCKLLSVGFVDIVSSLKVYFSKLHETCKACNRYKQIYRFGPPPPHTHTLMCS